MSRWALLTVAAVGMILAGCNGADVKVAGPPAVAAKNVWASGAYVVRRAAGPITIDDQFHADQWAGAMVMTNWLIPVDNVKAAEQTELRMLWDDENLYVHFIAYDTDIEASYADNIDVQNPIWEEDVVEIFLQPDGEVGKYHQVEVTPRNVMLALQIEPSRDSLAKRADWDHGIRRATFVSGTANAPGDEDKFYRVVMAIPFKSLQYAGGRTPTVGDKWRFLGSRNNISVKLAEGEPSACVKLSELDFHINPDYATLEFGK